MAGSLRRDKYERKVKEYWVDVKTSGSSEHVVAEEVLQEYQVVDPKLKSLPAPTLGKSPRPDLDADGASSDSESCDEGADDDDDEEDDKEASSEDGKGKGQATTRKAKSKAKEDRKGPSNRGLKRKRTKEMEEALEAGSYLNLTYFLWYYIALYIYIHIYHIV